MDECPFLGCVGVDSGMEGGVRKAGTFSIGGWQRLSTGAVALVSNR